MTRKGLEQEAESLPTRRQELIGEIGNIWTTLLYRTRTVTLTVQRTPEGYKREIKHSGNAIGARMPSPNFLAEEEAFFEDWLNKHPDKSSITKNYLASDNQLRFCRWVQEVYQKIRR